MAAITADMVKSLREKTGAGMMDCKTALKESNGEMEAAIDWLRAKGLSKAAKKADRIAAEGLIGVASAAKAGVSSTSRRMMVPAMRTKTLSRNGTRQPQLKKASCDI